MQVALTYDKGQVGQRFINTLAEKYGEPVLDNKDEGEVMWKTEEGESLISEVLTTHELGKVVFTLFAGSDEEDMSQFLSI